MSENMMSNCKTRIKKNFGLEYFKKYLVIKCSWYLFLNIYTKMCYYILKITNFILLQFQNSWHWFVIFYTFI